MTTSATNAHPAGPLPPAAPHLVAAAVEGLTTRLRKKLDAAVEQYAALDRVADGTDVVITCGTDAVVTLSPGPSGVIADAEQARCTCLLAPRCLHRAALLTACPLADPTPLDDALPDTGTNAADAGHRGPNGDTPGASTSGSTATPAAAGPVAASYSAETAGSAAGDPSAAPAEANLDAEPSASARPGPVSGPERDSQQSQAAGAPRVDPDTARPEPNGGRAEPSAAQVAAAAGLWRAAAAVLSTGVPGAGAVPQAELLKAAHTARLAGLPKAEAATLRVVRGLRAARARYDGHRLADLVSALRELLLTVGRLAASDPDPALIGTLRRGYRPNGGLKVHGVFREPVISSTGYGGVVTHLVTEDGRWFSVADVKPGGPSRARGAATATVAIGAAMMSHAQLARGGLLIAGATVSPDGRLGAGKGVRATPVAGLAWTDGPLADLFARPLAEAAGARLSSGAWSEEEAAEQVREPVGCDLVILGASGDHVLARELRPITPDPQAHTRDPRATGGDSPATAPDPQPATPDPQATARDAPSDPGTQAPGTDAPGTDAPGTDAPGSQAPGMQPSGMQPSGTGGDDSGTDEARNAEAKGQPVLHAEGPLIRLVPASRHPDLAHVENLRRLAARPGLCVRVVARVEPDRTATLRPLAVGPVPGAAVTLRLPAEWKGRADLGYDRLQGSHLPPQNTSPPPNAGPSPDTSPSPNAAPSPDASPASDGGPPFDTGSPPDADSSPNGGPSPDGSPSLDASPTFDVHPSLDVAPLPDGWAPDVDLSPDAGLSPDVSPSPGARPPSGARSPSEAPPPPGLFPLGQGGSSETDLLEAAPLWRVRRLVELAVSGGRRAVAESARSGDSAQQAAFLRRSGFQTAAELATGLADEADRRERDVFGRLTDSGPDGYARAWLAAATHLAATERALVRTSWQAAP
ncbi:hypothetical protein [Nonomuraea antri]|uniref:hypothetical protein n=1 Tax=Nonomuraea antri TaxID=2730852 RepID=UPI002E2E8202|nr:hypothetical protein [Nonomuraea antri]